MAGKVLKKPPLVEAIFELRWELTRISNGPEIDPYYKLLIGSIFDKVKGEYPYPEQLPTAAIPDEIAAYVVQHRFRKEKDKWPLIQIGPGIITLNDTERYEWEDFEKRILHVIGILFESYPEADKKLKINGALLRYINAIDFDYEKDHILAFLKEKLKTNIEITQQLFEDTGVGGLPLGLDLKFSFPSTKPKGVAHLRFVRGKIKEVDSLIWETQVQSIKDDAPKVKNEISAWIEQAHRLARDWFDKLTEGELRRRFE
jgi:uncharacterized protein (TIGR04255 family)